MVPSADDYPSTIHQAMRHSLFAGESGCGRFCAWKRGGCSAAMKKVSCDWEAPWN